MTTSQGLRPRLGISVSQGVRRGPCSPFLRFVRDHIEVLQKYQICATGGTAQSVLDTGLYECDTDIHFLRSGSQGGVVQLAAMVAKGHCAPVIFITDPRDLWADVPENHALKRVCIEREVRLITTYAGAVEWACFEAETAAKQNNSPPSEDDWEPLGWYDGQPNVEKARFLKLDTRKQTIALIAHDARKEHMARFVQDHIDLLRQFDRILTTGTTGWLLRLRYADSDDEDRYMRAALAELKGERFGTLAVQLEKLRKGKPNTKFSSKLLPLSSGPKGGDVLIANEILENRCHVVIFFYDPDTAHPHEADIRLLERTAQLPEVNALCVSDPVSADHWARRLEERT